MPPGDTLLWLAEEVRHLLRPVASPAPSYTVSVWCGAERDAMPGDSGPFGWAVVARGVSRFGLRPVLRYLFSRGWDTESTLVER
jgi:hypothetical protein